jgi:multicomponent Na+:H+ antiporter subunit E
VAAYLCLWIAIAGTDLRDLPAGVVTALAATWASLRLLPPTGRRPKLLAVLRLLGRLASQSVLAGLDVARRALDPRLPLRPGLVLFPTALAPGTTRSVFLALESLLPGTLPAGLHPSGAILVHCLDVDAPVESQMARDESTLLAAFDQAGDHG